MDQEPNPPATPADFKPGDCVLHKSVAYDEDPQLWVVGIVGEKLLTCRTWNPAAFKTVEEKFAPEELVRHDHQPSAIAALLGSVRFVQEKLRADGRDEAGEEVRQKAVAFFSALAFALDA